MFDHLLRDATHDLLRNDLVLGKLRIRSQITGLGRLFLKHWEHWCQLRARQEQQTAASPRAEPEPKSDPVHRPEPVRQSANANASEPAEADAELATAEGEPTSAASAPGKADRLLQRGFQNRRTRRALQFKKPSGKAASRRSGQLAAASQSATGSG
jgi:hypothetical protein